MAAIVLPRDRSNEQMLSQMLMSAVQGFQENRRHKQVLEQGADQFNRAHELDRQRFETDRALGESQITAAKDAELTKRVDAFVNGTINLAAERYFKRGEWDKGAELVATAMQNLEKVHQAQPNNADLATFRNRAAERFASIINGAPDTDADRATRESNRFIADSAARAASGGNSAQDINIATKAGTGEFQPAHSFGDLVQREAGPRDYGQYVDIEGGRTPSAASRLAADTSVKTTGMQTASAERIAALNNASDERAATIRATKGGKGAAGGVTPSHEARFDRIRASASDLIGRTTEWTTGYGSWLAAIPKTDARNYRADLQQLIADISFGALQDMRDNSKTGGALGGVAVRELELLGSTLGNIADTGQSKENLVKNLRSAIDSVNRWESALRQYGGAQSVVKNVTRAELQAMGATEEEAEAEGYTVID